MSSSSSSSSSSWTDWAWNRLSSLRTSPYVDWLTVLTPQQFKECLKHIINFRDLISCQNVCKKWKLIASDEELWTRLLKRDFDDIRKFRITYEEKKKTEKQKYAESYRYFNFSYKLSKPSLGEQIIKALTPRPPRLFNELLMFHPSNGRDNFLPFSPTVPYKDMPGKETLVKILKRENELRLSKEVQDEYWLTRDFLRITLRVQSEAVSQYGYTDPWIIPSALTYYKDDSDITSIPHYVQFNRSKQGTLNCCDAVPDIPLTSTHGCSTSLHSLLSPLPHGVPVVIAAGSYT